MPQVNGIGVAALPLKTCFQSQYSLPAFQRQYKWERNHFDEMVNDIQASFIEQYEPSHARRSVASYASYFLGSIITAGQVDGKKPIVDGQQRLTSLFILLAYLRRSAHGQQLPDIADLGGLLERTSYGSVDYVLDFSDSRKSIFSAFLDMNDSDTAALAKIDGLSGLDDGDHKVVDALRGLPSLISKEVNSVLGFFIDFVIEKVTMIEIAVPSENDAHRVFVTMNDRGLRLGPIDLLKGHVLSKITDEASNRDCHETWMKVVNGLKTIDPEEDSLFFRSMLRARWAETARDKKKKGELPGDFELIADGYHRWFAERAAKFGYISGDHYEAFAQKEVPTYAEAYQFIRDAEVKLNAEAPHIFYNAARKFTLQPMVLLGPIVSPDSAKEWKAKSSLMARFWDLVLTSRAIEGKDNKYDSVRDLAFDTTKQVRGMTLGALGTWVAQQWPQYYAAVSRIDLMSYRTSDQPDLLYVLARIATFIEGELAIQNGVGFDGFWSRSRGTKTFDIEHALASTTPNVTALGFAGQAEFNEQRNLLGGLLLLGRSRNRSLKDAPYPAKLHAYATENVLAQTLCPGLYSNNPPAKALAGRLPGLVPFAVFDKAAIAARASLYRDVALEIWKTP